MTPDELRVQQNAITAPVTGLTLQLLRRLPLAPLAPSQFVALVALLFPPVQRARARGVDLARDYYRSLNPAGTAPSVPAPDYDPPMLGKTLSTYVKDRIAEPETHEIAATQGAAAVARHVEQAGREYVALASSRDDVRYARYDPYGETCAFCRLLISRGPIYLSQSTGAFQSHPQCTCVAVPVFGDDWPGREQAEEAERLYIESTSGLSGKEAMRAFRAAIEKTG